MSDLRGRRTALEETERELEKLNEILYSGNVITCRDIQVLINRINKLIWQRDNYIQKMRNMYINGTNIYGAGMVPDYIGDRILNLT